MSTAEFALLLAAVLCCIGFTALIVVLVRVLDSLRTLHSEVEGLRAETRPLLAELRSTTDDARRVMGDARADLARFDRVLGSAEAISDAMTGTSRVTRAAFSTPVIKATALAAGTGRAARRLRRRTRRGAPAITEAAEVERRAVGGGAPRRSRGAGSRG